MILLPHPISGYNNRKRETYNKISLSGLPYVLQNLVCQNEDDLPLRGHLDRC